VVTVRQSLARLLGVAAVAVGVVVPVAPVLPLAVGSVHAAGLGAGGEYHPLTPQRIYDSRVDSPGPKAMNRFIPAFDIPLRGKGGVPSDPAGVLAVVVNITVAAPTASGWLNALGTDGTAGEASILNFSAGQTVANAAIVRPGADGNLRIQLFSADGGTAHVLVDVFGWYSTSASSDTSGARLVPVVPGRVLDTRGSNTPLGPASSLTVPIRGVTLPSGAQIPANPNVVGAVLNLTGVNNLGASATTFVSVTPDPAVPSALPATSNLNLTRGQIKPNLVIVPVGSDGTISIFNEAGSVHLLVDIVGYLLANQDPSTTTGRVVPLSAPFRVFDTRLPGFGATPISGNQREDWSFADFASSVTIGGVPVGQQLGVIGNLTVASVGAQSGGGARDGYVTVYPANATEPNVSNLNTVVGGGAVPNMALLTYSGATTVRVYNYVGATHYLFDASAVVLA